MFYFKIFITRSGFYWGNHIKTKPLLVLDKGIKEDLDLLFASVIYSSDFYPTSQRNICAFVCKANIPIMAFDSLSF